MKTFFSINWNLKNEIFSSKSLENKLGHYINRNFDPQNNLAFPKIEFKDSVF